VCQSEKEIRTVHGIGTLILVIMGKYVKFSAIFKYLPSCESV
jgi:hypothetical protein